eukprot:13612081-Alexandrium_andersonii.AAC.1
MAKPTPRFTQTVASWRLWRAKYVPRRTCSNSAGPSRSLGRPYKWSASLSGLGPGGPVLALEKVSQGVPTKTKS